MLVLEVILLILRAPGEDEGRKGTPRPRARDGQLGRGSLSPLRLFPHGLLVGWLEVVSMSIIADI